MDKALNKTIFSFLLPLVFFIMFDIFFIAFNYNEFGIPFYELTAIFGYFILYMVYFIFWGITKKSNKSLIIIVIVLLIYSILSQIKISYTGDPILFSDILFLNNMGELTDIVGSTLINSFKPYLLKMIVFFLLSALLCILATKMKIDIKSRKIRIYMIIIPTIILTILFIPSKTVTNSMFKFVSKISYRYDYNRATSKNASFGLYGVVFGMYYDLLENRIYEPKDYNENIVNQVLKNAKNDSDNAFGKPNLIVVFSESFWDIDQLEEVKFNKKVTENFNNLKENGIFIDMISPSYGGVSSNIEFEFLTGANLMFFNEGFIPTMQLYRNKTYFDRPSIIKELKNNGYKTKIINYTPENSFSIGKFYKYIGVDETEFIVNVEDKSNYVGKYISDEYVTSKIIEELTNKKNNEKIFLMTLTMQSHMPYLIDKYEKYDISISKSNLTKEMNDVLLSYAQGIYDADKQLGRLYDFITNFDEPTMIVFYGDHLPYLKTNKNENILDYLEFFNTDDKKLNLFRKYNTQCLILANFEIEDKNTKYLGPDLLGNYIINRMDINISNYYKWLYNNKYTLPSSNWYICMDKNGELYYTKELNKKMKDVYNLRKNIEYKLFVK